MDSKDEEIKNLKHELRMQKLANQSQRNALKHLVKALMALGGYS